MSRLAADGFQKPASNRLRTSSWADGLRGIASVFVVSSHITLCFATWVMPPAVAETGEQYLFQRPFFRLVGQGNAWVAVFFILLGFVNSLKTVQLARVGAVDDALNSLATSTFRRTARLVLPAAAVTVLSWWFCQWGAFDLASRTDAFWLKDTSPKPSVSWLAAIGDLFRELVNTWTESRNAYDQPQWALLYLLKGSLYVFVTLLATVKTTSRFRLTAEILLYIWCWRANDAIIGINVFAGMILAELSMTAPSQTSPTRGSISKGILRQIIPYFFAVLGLYLCSFPDSYYEVAPWSNRLYQIGQMIFPANPLYGRFWPGIGAQMLCAAILYSPSMRTALSHRYLLWLGALSFPLYLLHGPFLRSLMTYMIFLPSWWNGSPSPIPVPGTPMIAIMLPIFFAILLVVVKLWAVHVEPYFGVMTDRFERFAHSWGKGGAAGGASSSLGYQNGHALPLHRDKK